MELRRCAGVGLSADPIIHVNPPFILIYAIIEVEIGNSSTGFFGGHPQYPF